MGSEDRFIHRYLHTKISAKEKISLNMKITWSIALIAALFVFADARYVKDDQCFDGLAWNDMVAIVDDEHGDGAAEGWQWYCGELERCNNGDGEFCDELVEGVECGAEEWEECDGEEEDWENCKCSACPGLNTQECSILMECSCVPPLPPPPAKKNYTFKKITTMKNKGPGHNAKKAKYETLLK